MRHTGQSKTIDQRRTHRFVRTALALALGATGLLTQAAEVTWTGGTGDWSDASRWNPGAPGYYLDARIGGDSGPTSFVTLSRGTIGSLQNLTVGATGTLAVRGVLSMQGNLVSTGQLRLGESQQTGGNATVHGSRILLGGSGTTTIAGSARLTSLGNMLIEAGHTLVGTGGTIMVPTIENRGTITASGVLTLDGWNFDAPTLKNTGVIRVTGGGILDSQTYALDNTGGLIDIVDGRILPGGVTGGMVRGHGSNSVIDGHVSNGAILEGSLQSSSLVIGGEVINNSVLTLTRPGGDEAYLYGSGTLAGHGEVRTAGDAPAILSNTTFGAEQTFRGTALIKDGLTNHGSFIVQGSKGLAIDYWNTNWANDGVIRITEGSVLNLDRSQLNNQGGQLVFEGGSKLVSGGKIVGGTLSASKSTALQGSVNFQDVELKGDWQTSSNFVLGVTGNIRVDGTLTIGDAPSLSYSSYLYLRGDTTLSGPGETVLNGGPTRSSYITTQWPYDPPGSVLTIDTDHTLRGNGIIGVNTLNKGLLLADVPTGALQIQATLTNAGTVRIAAGASLLSSVDVDNRGGFIDIADGGTLRVHSGRLDGGVIQGQGSASSLGVFDLHDATLKGTVSVSEWTLFGTNGSLGISGTVSNRGVLLVGGVNQDGNTRGNIIVRGTTTLQGEGRTELRGNGALFGESREAHLIIAADHTVAGSGLIADLSLTNRGKLDVQGDGIRALRMQAFANEGQLTVHKDSSLQSDVGIVQTGADSRTRINGRLEAPAFYLQGGVLSGGGELVGDLNVGAATVRAGGADGTLRVKGNYAASADSTLFLDLSSASSLDAPWLVSGDADLSGLLVLSFGADAKWDEGLTILSSGGAITGTFSALQVLGSDEKWVLAYFKDHVTVSLASAVPEPSSVGLFGIGLLAVVLGRRCGGSRRQGA